MKHTRHAPSVTSIPRAPHDDDRKRVRTYAITMGVRMVCFVLMATVTPYGWYTWVFAAGAIVLPYIAVVLANAAHDSRAPSAESPAFRLEGPGSSEASGETSWILPSDDDPSHRRTEDD